MQASSATMQALSGTMQAVSTAMWAVSGTMQAVTAAMQAVTAAMQAMSTATKAVERFKLAQNNFCYHSAVTKCKAKEEMIFFSCLKSGNSNVGHPAW